MNRPNFMIFVVDQMQSYTVGCNGDSIAKTPTIDRIAREGVNFSKAYTTNPACSPTRASLLTGLMPSQHGLLTNGMNLDEEIPTVTRILNNNGYKTYSAGKLHIQAYSGDYTLEGKDPWYNGEVAKLPEGYYGFEQCDLTICHGQGVGGDYRNWLKEHYPEIAQEDHEKASDTILIPYSAENAPKIFGFQCWEEQIPVELHYNNWIADRTIDFLEEVGDDNFFVWCSFPDPHLPYTACKEYIEQFNLDDMKIPESFYLDDSESSEIIRRNHHAYFKGDEEELKHIMLHTYAKIKHIDDNMARVIEKLKEKDLYDNTVLVFMSDHGEYLGGHHLLKKGDFLFEELVRVPYIWKVPNATRIDCDDTVSTLSFAPTILELAQIDQQEMAQNPEKAVKRENFKLAGQSLYKYLMKEEWEREPYAYLEHFSNGIGSKAIFSNQYKLIVNTDTYIKNTLIDLENDPLELKNHWDEEEYQSVQQELLLQLGNQSIQMPRYDNPKFSIY